MRVMLVYVYLFCLIVGGVLLGASILLGGKDADADADQDLDLDHEGDACGDHDAHVDQDMDLDGGHGGFDAFLWTFASIRFWTFFLAFFGITGLTLDALTDSRVTGLVTALAMGLLTGFGATAVIRRLSRQDTTSHGRRADYIGKTARVMVPVKRDGVGKVRIELKGNTVDVLAVTDDDRPFEARDQAMIIEMDGTRARIARVDQDS